MTHKWVYIFSKQKTEGDRHQKNLLGGKGANLAEMTNIGLPVPPGFTISTEACLDFYKLQKKINPEIRDQVQNALNEIEQISGKKFGDPRNPLLFSVRSGSRASMPGMMDTVLNLGLNDEVVEGLAKKSGNERFAWDSYRRFIQMFSDVVLGLNVSVLEVLLEELKEERGFKEDTQLSARDLKLLVQEYKKTLGLEFGVTFPTNPMEQLWSAIGAVFGSWNNPRALRYRQLHNYPDDWGTAVNVQSMVYGNMGDDCATGVCFTRDPSNGEKRFYGEYLINAQGEDVVAGIRTPCPISTDSKNESNKHLKTLEETMPAVYKELVDVYQKLETHYRDMQDIEFTIETGKLYLLQTRNGKRTTNAAIRIAVDFVNEGVITKKEAIQRIKPDDLNQLLHPRLDPKANKKILATGLPASPGAASGMIVFSPDHAHHWHSEGRKVLLVRAETSPEDINGMIAAEGILTARGGMTSHAAVVARGMGKPCVAGCSALFIKEEQGTCTVGGKTFKEGDYLTIDGATGEVIDGQVPTVEAEISDAFSIYMGWADEFRKLGIRTNADTPADARTAIHFGAEGIGLCRTEHMFFEAERILAVREMIFSQSLDERRRALRKIIPFQRQDFIGIFTEMNGFPVNIRLLDPPLHEFLPHREEEKKELANVLGIKVEEVEKRAELLHEFNPMLGHRGCRLGVTFPEIYQMQVRAIIEAGIECEGKGIKVIPEIMIPLIARDRELIYIKEKVISEIELVMKEKGKTLKYKLGTMIELPRAALTAGEIAKVAEFFSFGTNDLTQTTLGLSRDDAGSFLPFYVEKKLFDIDPFVTIDQTGVGVLIEMAVREGKKANPQLHTGICGEHGGDPASIGFCHKVGLDYVSCSPFRVPIARLAAAQAALES